MKKLLIKLDKLIKQFCTREIIFYTLFGILTTFVNLGTFFMMTSHFHINADLSNFIAISLAIIFAYITNRKWVFHTTAKGLKENFYEFCKFIAGRSITMIIEWSSCFILFKTAIPHIINKCIVSVMIVILNYMISKFFTFKNKAK